MKRTIILPIGGGGGGVQPTGTLRVTAQGTYDVTNYEYLDVDVQWTDDYLCFEALEDNTTIRLTTVGSNSPNLEYSTDKQNWTTWDYTNLTINTGDKLYFRGNNPTGLQTTPNDYSYFYTGKNVKCSGNIQTLLNYITQLDYVPGLAFYRLFYNSKITTAPTLPATTLRNRCYGAMFYGCTSLVSAPALPATTLATSCYNSMFYNCTSLVNAPALPAITLANNCYQSMFYGCTSLVNAPALPAITLVNSCYSQMFRSCTSLVNAPALPATTLTDGCYHQMFYGCSSLNDVTTYAESWNASYTTNWLYGVAQSGTFHKLTDTNIPTNSTSGIPTGWTVSYLDLEYFNFEDISGSNNTLTLTRYNSNGQCPVVNLEYSTDGQNWQEWQAVNDVRTYIIPANGKFYLRGDNTAFGQNANGTDYHQFASTGNIEAHGNIMTLLDKTGVSDTITSTGCFRSLFKNMTTLKTAPELPATTLNNAAYVYMFINTGITEAPDLPATRIGNGYYYGMFYQCASLTKAAKMTINEFISGHVNACREMYYGCSALTDISGITINATNISSYAFKLTFQNCTSLTKAVPMTIAQVGEFAFDSCYEGCSALTDISGIHITAASASEGAFKIMFRGTAITESPDLSSITTLYSATNNGSFSFMFQNCVNLNKVIVGCSTWNTDYANSWLDNVASSGDFYNLGGATIPTGTNGIPTNWTEHTQIPVTYLSYIHKDVLESQIDSTNKATDKINTLISPPNSGYSFRLKGKYKGYPNGGALCGVGDITDSSPSVPSFDDVKFRVFSYASSKFFDCGNYRFDSYSFSMNEEVDITVTNCGYYDNINSTQLYTGPIQTLPLPMQGYTFLADCSTWWLKSLEIFDENNNTVFNGVAALYNGEYGLWDSVTNQLFTNSTINIVGEQ